MVLARRLWHHFLSTQALPVNDSKRGFVVQYPNVRSTRACGHESISRAHMARRIAALKDYEFSEAYQPERYGGAHVYYVPDDTLTAGEARELDIHSEQDLFGGVVPHPFVASKTVTHGLVDPEAAAPEGWSRGLAKHLHGCVLPGYAAFTAADARQAAARMLRHGAARVKPAWGIGGSGQATITDIAEFDAFLATIDAADLTRYGAVVEPHLEEVVTYSIGQVHISGVRISYFGAQHLTPNNSGDEVYGGSSLVVVPGELDTLLELTPQPGIETAVSLAIQYDTAMALEFPELLASRRNYDVIRGRDSRGSWRTGVLEQSWRIGGASPAEIAAFEAFQENPALRMVRASCVEAYGEHEPPAGAVIYFRGEDERVGQLTKYAYIEGDENSA